MKKGLSEWTGRNHTTFGSRAMSNGSEKQIKLMKIEELKLKFTKENSDRLFKEMS